MDVPISGAARDERRDAQLRIRVRPEGVFLVVTAPEGDGKPINRPLVERAMSQKEIIEVDWSAVHKALEGMTGEPVLVAPRHTNLDRDASVSVDLSQDLMEAYVNIHPALGGQKVSSAQVFEALRAAGVTEGIDPAAVETAVAEQHTGGRFLVARGRPPVNGQDGSIAYLFETRGIAARPLELEDGRVDYYNLNAVQTASAGQVLAVRTAPTAGSPGATVTGRPLGAKSGRDVRLPKGKNTDVNPVNPDELVAIVSGQVLLQAGKVSVLPVYEVRGDVDFGTGNIDFVGAVTVQGSVASGFTVRATGNVEVRGSVEAASILAGGDVIIHRGVQGGDRGRLSGRNIQAKFIQNCRVEATGDVLVDEALMYADVSAQGRVEVRGSKGRIVGGFVRAVQSVSARVIGSKLGTRTEIQVGVNPDIRAEFEQLTRDLGARERQLEEVAKGVRVLKEAATGGRPLPGGDPERVGKLLAALSQLSEEVETMRTRREELDTIVNGGGPGLIKALDTVHPGVRVTIGPISLNIQDESAKALFYLESGEIRMGSA